MDYTSTLETLEGLSNALARHFAHHVGAWEILHALVKVKESQKLLVPEISNGSEQGTFFTLV